MALGVAERADVIVDFTGRAGKTLYLENRLVQTNGRGPDGQPHAPPARATCCSRSSSTCRRWPTTAATWRWPLPTYYALPSTNATPRVQRSFNFDQTRNGEWTVNDQFFEAATTSLPGQAEQRRDLGPRQNGVRDWQHPIHVHFEEFQILSGSGGALSADSQHASGWGGGRLGQRRAGAAGAAPGRGEQVAEGRRPPHRRGDSRACSSASATGWAATRCTATTWSTRTTP